MKWNRLVPYLLFATTLGTPCLLRADDQPMSDKDRIERLEKENKELRKRLEILEEKLGQNPYVEKESVPETTRQFLGQTEISGYVSASYFYNFNRPSGGENTGPGFDVRHNEFMANKLVLTLEKPVEYNAFDWQAGYLATLIFGQDAEFTQAAGLGLGDQGDLLEANLTVNAPIGNGLKIIFGKYGTTIG